MIPARDWHIILECVHSKNWNSHLLCEFPEACNGCLYQIVHGTHKIKKALRLYHEYQKQLNEEWERDNKLYY